MSDQRIKIPRASDRRIAETFIALGEKYGILNASVGALAFSNLRQISLSQEPTGAWKSLLDHDSYLIDTMSFAIHGLTITYARGGNCTPDKKSPIFDEIIFVWNANQNTAPNGQKLRLLGDEEKLDVVSFLNEKLHPFEIGRTIDSGVSEEQSQLLAIHQCTLERLEALNEQLIEKSSEFRRTLEDRFEEKLSIAEQDYRDKKLQLESEGQAFAAQVVERERALEEKLKVIDDRDNTHVRREIRDRMLNDVKARINQFGLSRTTESKRTPVLKGIVLLTVVFIILLGWTGYELNMMDGQYLSTLGAIQSMSSLGADKIKAAELEIGSIGKIATTDLDKTHIFLLWGRFTLLSFGLIATLIYYIKWQNRWAEQHIGSEFQLQQFYIDVNRANWVIESCLEWRKETESAIPKELLGSITNGLFVNNQGEPERVIHPADELASALLGTASKLKLKVGDSEVHFDKPNKIPNKPISAGKTGAEE